MDTMHQYADHTRAPAAMLNLNERIRQRISGIMQNVVTRIVEFGTETHWPGHMVLVTAQGAAQLPEAPELKVILDHGHDLVQGLLKDPTRTLASVSERCGRSLIKGASTFIASVLAEAGSVTRAVLTIGVNGSRTELIVSDEVGLLAAGPEIDVVISAQGGYRIRR